MKRSKVSVKILAILTIVAMLASSLAVAVTASGTTAPASGYAAVGIVDAEACNAEVLLGTGEQGTVRFEGEAPAAGAVYRYTRSARNVYTFTLPVANHGHSDQFTKSGWLFYSNKNGWLWNGMGQIYFPSTNPIFFRFGENQWAVLTIHQFEGEEGKAPMCGYALDAAEDGGSFYPGAFVFGDFNDDGSVDKTGFDVMVPSLTATNNLSAFTIALHEAYQEAGYAAIGKVDSEEGLVEILKGTGEHGYVSFIGMAPVTGGVYRFVRNAANTYLFTEPTANHGNSKVHDPSAAAWQMGMSEEFGCYMWDGAYNHYWPAETTPVFVHKSPTTWVVTTKDCFTTNVHVMAYQLDTTLQAGSTSYFDAAAMVFGGLNPDGTINTMGLDQLKLSDAEVDLSELTTPLHPVAQPDPTDPDPTDPDPTTPDPTVPDPTTPDPTTPDPTVPDPTVPAPSGKYTASGEVTGTGYAAVGVVDLENSKAEVLLNNGKHGTVYYAGTAPKSGAVYGYEKHSNNVYVFIEKVGNHGHSNQLAANSAWNLWLTTSGWAWDANQPTDIFYAPTPTPIFLRYGDNQWALLTTNKVKETNGASWAWGYALDTVHQPELDSQNNCSNFATGALVMGNMNADGTIDTTGYAELFSNAGDKISIGSFTTDLATPIDGVEPEPEETYTASGRVVKRGYAAIGVVNARSSKVEVLLGDGSHGTVHFAGIAPKSGAVYGYELHSNNVYVFIEKVGNHGHSNQLAANSAWNLWLTTSGWAWDANQPTDIFYVPTPTPIFLRYGDNQWALITLDKVKETNGTSWAWGYALDTVHQPELDPQNNCSNFATGALVMGNMNADGTIDTTGFAELFSRAGTKIDLGSFTNELVVTPVTGDTFPVAAVIVIMLLSAGALGILAVDSLVKKKRAR